MWKTKPWQRWRRRRRICRCLLAPPLRAYFGASSRLSFFFSFFVSLSLSPFAVLRSLLLVWLRLSDDVCSTDWQQVHRAFSSLPLSLSLSPSLFCFPLFSVLVTCASFLFSCIRPTLYMPLAFRRTIAAVPLPAPAISSACTRSFSRCIISHPTLQSINRRLNSKLA